MKRRGRIKGSRRLKFHDREERMLHVKSSFSSVEKEKEERRDIFNRDYVVVAALLEPERRVSLLPREFHSSPVGESGWEGREEGKL